MNYECITILNKVCDRSGVSGRRDGEVLCYLKVLTKYLLYMSSCKCLAYIAYFLELGFMCSKNRSRTSSAIDNYRIDYNQLKYQTYFISRIDDCICMIIAVKLIQLLLLCYSYSASVFLLPPLLCGFPSFGKSFSQWD